MKLRIACLCVFLFQGFALSAQSLADKYRKGEIQLKDGTQLVGYIFYSFEHVAHFQNSVSFLSQENYDVLASTGKIKLKSIQKFSPKEVTFYQLEDGPKYVAETYADISSLGPGSLPKKVFVEELVTGKIKLYKRYQPIGGVVAGEEAELVMAGGEALAERNKSSYQWLIIKDSKNLKELQFTKLADLIGDNAALLAKYQANDYGIRDIAVGKLKTEEEKQSFLSNLKSLLMDYNRE